MAKLLWDDGQETEVMCSKGRKEFTLRELQYLTTSQTIEIMELNENTFLVFDEEGKLKNLPYNKKATDLVIQHSDIDSFGEPGTWSKDLDQERDYIVGEVLVCSREEIGE